jgi:hypothetical protein
MVTTSPNTTPHPTTKRYDPYTCTQAAVYAQPAQMLTPDCRGVMIRMRDSPVPSCTRILEPVISSSRLVVDKLTISQVTLSIITKRSATCLPLFLYSASSPAVSTSTHKNSILKAPPPWRWRRQQQHLTTMLNAYHST